MKIDKVLEPKSSFLSVEKDLSIIVNKILKNERLKKLLYYPTSDCLSKPKLTEDQSLELLGSQILIVPKLEIDDRLQNYLMISYNNFFVNIANPEFRDSVIEFDIICHFEGWSLGDFELRPYKIAAELDSMFNNQRLTGIGTLEFVRMQEIPIDESFAGFSLVYRAVHGEEDKKGFLNPSSEVQYRTDFRDSFLEE